MKKVAIMILFFCLSNSGFSDYLGSKTPGFLYGHQYVVFGINSPPSGTTCSYWGRQMRFDATTPSGKVMLTILMTAIASKRNVDLWYTPSSNPGTDQTNGCTEAGLATVTAIGISK